MLALAVATGLAAASLAAWLAILAHPARPWDLQPIGEDVTPPAPPAAWPTVCALVPARNEATYVPVTLPALLRQDYPGEWRAVLVDDRSRDGTGEVARALADERLTVVAGAPLPDGWAGKVWALEQGLAAAGRPDYLLLTDADIRHDPGSLRRLVAESEAGGLALDSRMALLACRSRPERLLLPAYLFFFCLLYPPRRANDPGDPLASAAGGCILVRRDALERAGGFASIRGEVIDDLNLARRVKELGVPIRLAVSRADVESLRRHESLGSIWRMIRRAAFDELRYSWLRLAGTVLGLLLLFAIPPAAIVAAVALAAVGADAGLTAALGLLGLAAWAVSAGVYSRAVGLLGVPRRWAATLPLAGVLYGAMTVDSALRHLTRRAGGW